MSYSQGNAHAWSDPASHLDGHIIGPGFVENFMWVRAWPVKSLVLQRVFDCAAFHPGGISEISRWLSVATPPEIDSRSAF